MMKLIFTIFLIMVSTNVFADGFFIKINNTQYNDFVEPRINQIRNNRPNWFLPGKEKFKEYTFHITDQSTGDRYYKIENIQYEGIHVNIIDYINNNYPSLTQYDYDHVKQFIPQNTI